MKQQRVWKIWQKAAAVAVAAAALAGCGGGGGATATKATSTGTVSTANGTTAAEVTVSAPAGVTLTVPAATTLADASGAPVTGAVNTSVSYSATASDLPAAAATVPTGSTLAGFTEISMGAVKTFSQPVSLTLKVSGAAAGDTLELYSFDTAAATPAWKYEGLQTVTTAGTITPAIKHLSVWGAFKTAKLHPAAPTGLQASVDATSQIKVAWDAAADTSVTGYKVYLGTAPGVYPYTWDLQTSTSQTIATLPDGTALSGGTIYYLAVTAVNANGESVPSSEAVAIIKPRSIAASGADGQVGLAWEPVPGATSYNIYYGTTGTLTTSSTKLASTAASSYTATTANSAIANETTYFFAVTAVKGSAESPLSSTKSAKPSATPQAPGTPSGVDVPATSTGDVTVSWAAIVPFATSYNVHYLQAATKPTNNAVLGSTTKVNSTTSPATIRGLAAGTYWIMVTSVNAVGESVGQIGPKQVVVAP